MKRFLLAAAALLALSGQAAADAVPSVSQMNNGCVQYKLCDAETDTTAACDDGSSNIVADVGSRAQFTAYATQSTASALVCDLYTSDNGYSATLRSALTSSASGTQLTESAYTVSFSGTLRYVWAECTTITSGNVTINLLACPVTR